MRSFLGKHSNRSSHALVEPRTPSKTPSTSNPNQNPPPASGSAATPQTTAHQRQASHQPQLQHPQDQHYQVQQHQQLLDEADSASHGAHFGHSQPHSHNSAGANASTNNPSGSNITPHSALPSSHNTAYSSSESFDSQQQPPTSHYLQKQQPPLHLQHPHPQQQQQQQQPLPLIPSPSSASAGAPPPPHLYSSPSAASSTTGANIHNNPPSLQQQQSSNLSNVAFDAQQPRGDFNDSGIGRSQSIRYSSATPYNIDTSSVDDLNRYSQQIPPQQLQQQQQQQQQAQPAPPAEKRSTRKLIKGIFSGSNRGASDNQHHHGISIGHGHNQSYDNTGGLARRPSKRQSAIAKQPQPSGPVQNPTQSPFSSPAQAQAQIVHTGYHWRQPPSPPPPAQAEILQQVQQLPESQRSPLPQLSSRQGLDDINEQYIAHQSNQPSPSQTSRISLHNTIRQVSGEVDQQQHQYEDTGYHQNQAPQQQQQPPPQPHVQVHTQDQQQQPGYETNAYDQQSSPSNQPQHSPSQQPYQFPNAQQQPNYHQGGNQGGELRSAPAHLGPSNQFQNPETVSEFSHESPIADSDQRSANLQSASTSPAVNHVYIQNQGSTPSLPPAQQITPQPQQPGMAPPTGGPPASRRPEAEKLRGQADVPGGPPPTYRPGNSMNNMNPLPPVPGQAAGQPQAYRGDRPPQFEGQAADQGRDSPQPVSAVPADSGENDKSFKDLLTKYKNVKRLYFDGKGQIEVLNGQIVHLQNAVANQRMSQSRTALDDSEYSTRFNRLNGAINNLSFNIRKDWRCVPQWLDKYVSADALKTGKAEMTAVGRAVISRWLMEEVFNKCFHPGLDAQLSQSLKEIELGIRNNTHTMTSQEEFDALTNKIVSWRMSSLDGLHRQLNSPAANDNRNTFIDKTTSNLTACLYQFLNTPPPPGVEGSTSMIVELAVGIAANLPLESRDVAITYPLPGEIVQPHVMEVEKAALPTLEAQKGEGDGEDKDGNDEKNGKAKTGTLNKVTPPESGEGNDASTSTRTDADKDTFVAALPKDTNRVRFAGFMALEVRGRQVLMKAPIWTL
ncbi:hypothetical protein NW762_005021 [Fusarium torreyae]|uniref:S-adenosylmethionine-dependent methyltransferase-like protein n=1 Tax=Fusarium torreyae TaxID=1237075 RepID=A0A9W8S4P3_9HYPO|nr:hypothetical protein NW762_005021 [Fusarium torreyae]